MHVEVIGHRSKRLKELMINATKFYCSLLMTKRMCDSLEIYILLKKHLEEDYSGFCMFLDHYDGIRTFEIELAKGYTVNETLSSLAHELVHLKQFAKGELKDDMVTASIFKWKGQDIDENKVNYWDLPFEIEAYGREKGLHTRFLSTITSDDDKKFLETKVK